MRKKLLLEDVFDTVVIKTWAIPGPGDDYDTPRVLSSYSVQGAPAVVMTGEGMETHEEAALAAVNVVAAYLKAQIARFPRDDRDSGGGR
jgi:hypothetical protein